MVSHGQVPGVGGSRLGAPTPSGGSYMGPGIVPPSAREVNPTVNTRNHTGIPRGLPGAPLGAQPALSRPRPASSRPWPHPAH
jgi:hypothetical protein